MVAVLVMVGVGVSVIVAGGLALSEGVREGVWLGAAVADGMAGDAVGVAVRSGGAVLVQAATETSMISKSVIRILRMSLVNIPEKIPLLLRKLPL